MTGFLLVGGCKTPHHISRNKRFIPVSQFRFEGVKTHHAADGITAKYYRAGAKTHFAGLQSKWINVDDILQVPAPENGIVHPHPIDTQHHPVGGESPDHRTSSTQLALLHKDVA